MKYFILFAALVASASAACMGTMGKACLPYNSIHSHWQKNKQFTTPKGHCFSDNGKQPHCFVNTNWMQHPCDCKNTECGCSDFEVQVDERCKAVAQIQKPDCSANKARYANLGSDNTMNMYCGVSNTCNKVCYRGSALTAAEKAALLKKHNELRADVANGRAKGVAADGVTRVNTPTAANMRELTWDDDIAAGAQMWADQCPEAAHDKNRKTPAFPTAVGQNVYTGWASSYDANWAPVYTSAVQMWFDEIEFWRVAHVGKFRQNTNPAEVIGHYTQVAWGETSKLGCGAIAFFNDGKYYRRVVCNYGIAGNWPKAVYQTGPVASACPNGKSTNYAGLCA